jgi:hypothetical protein
LNGDLQHAAAGFACLILNDRYADAGGESCGAFEVNGWSQFGEILGIRSKRCEARGIVGSFDLNEQRQPVAFGSFR